MAGNGSHYMFEMHGIAFDETREVIPALPVEAAQLEMLSNEWAEALEYCRATLRYSLWFKSTPPEALRLLNHTRRCLGCKGCREAGFTSSDGTQDSVT